MAKFRKGQNLVCVPCGREVVVSSEGVARTTLYCCGTPMSAGKKAARGKRPSSRRTVKKESRRK